MPGGTRPVRAGKEAIVAIEGGRHRGPPRYGLRHRTSSFRVGVTEPANNERERSHTAVSGCPLRTHTCLRPVPQRRGLDQYMSTRVVRLPRTLTVGIIGAGRVGAILGAALAAAGHKVIAASGVSDASRSRIDRLLPGARLVPVDQVPTGVDLLIVAVPDDSLAGLVAGLVEAGSISQGQIVAHTSGAHGLGVLAPVVAAGARPLALHPAMTF